MLLLQNNTPTTCYSLTTSRIENWKEQNYQKWRVSYCFSLINIFFQFFCWGFPLSPSPSLSRVLRSLGFSDNRCFHCLSLCLNEAEDRIGLICSPSLFNYAHSARANLLARHSVAGRPVLHALLLLLGGNSLSEEMDQQIRLECREGTPIKTLHDVFFTAQSSAAPRRAAPPYQRQFDWENESHLRYTSLQFTDTSRTFFWEFSRIFSPGSHRGAGPKLQNVVHPPHLHQNDFWDSSHCSVEALLRVSRPRAFTFCAFLARFPATTISCSSEDRRLYQGTFVN